MPQEKMGNRFETKDKGPYLDRKHLIKISFLIARDLQYYELP